ncbi:MAG TPA: MBL fold metallo-hydrolase [Balneolales bacterium]|nr:MBL fold metallo-hydrolase [Balneolales bacterium]
MEIVSYTVNPFRENTYLLIDDGEALLVDPGFADESEWEPVARKLEETKAKLSGILLTHAHIDHILGIPLVRKMIDQDLQVWMHPDDKYFWDYSEAQGLMFGIRIDDLGPSPLPIHVRENWKMDRFVFEVRHTPGHAPGHVVFYLENEGLLIGGDALFRDSVGRTDLHGGDFKQLEKSIRTQIYTLPDSTRVLPGHGPETTVGYEKEHNPFVKATKYI